LLCYIRIACEVVLYNFDIDESSLCYHSRQAKKAYEKVGEATETAMSVLVEKMNVFKANKSGLSNRELGTLCCQQITSQWRKEFTLEFSRDRKSMSVLCIPLQATKLPGGPKMFVKVSSSKFCRSPSPSNVMRSNYANCEV